MGKYELNDWKSIEKFINRRLRLNEDGEKAIYTNWDTGDKIILSGLSAGKLAGNYKDGDIYQKSIAHIPKIIKNMRLLEEMVPEKSNAKYNKYSYFITGINMTGKPYVILSVVGHNEQGIYYTQNVLEGTKREIFAKVKNGTDNPQYSRLNEILAKIKEDNWKPIGIINPELPVVLAGD